MILIKADSNSEWDQVSHFLLELEQNLYENYPKPEQTINISCVLIDKWGISFIGYGKHSNDEFYTTELKIEQLQNLIK